MAQPGWVKLPRQIRDSWLYQDDSALRVFMEVLLTAAFTDRTWKNNGEEIRLEKGEVVTSVRSISEATGMARSTVHRALSRLVDRGILGRRAGHSSGHLVGHHATIVSLSEPGLYVGGKDEGGTPSGTPSGTEVGHPSKEEGKKEDVVASSSSSFHSDSEESTSPGKPDDERDEIQETLDRYVEQWNKAARIIPQLAAVDPGRWSPATRKQYLGFVRSRRKEAAWSWTDALREVYLAKEFAYRFLTLEWVLRPTNYPKLLQGQYRAENVEERKKSVKAKAKKAGAGVEHRCPTCGGPASYNYGRLPEDDEARLLFYCRSDECDQERELKTEASERRWSR